MGFSWGGLILGVFEACIIVMLHRWLGLNFALGYIGGRLGYMLYRMENK